MTVDFLKIRIYHISTISGGEKKGDAVMTMSGSTKMNPTATAGAAAASSCHQTEHTVCTVDTRALVSISIWAVRLWAGRLEKRVYRGAGSAAA